jgi:hypothetical protein
MTNADLQDIINRLAILDRIPADHRTADINNTISDLLDQIRNSGPNPAWAAQMARIIGN